MLKYIKLIHAHIFIIMLGVVSLQRLNIKTVHLHHNGYLEICFKISISNRRWISYIYDCENMLQTC